MNQLRTSEMQTVSMSYRPTRPAHEGPGTEPSPDFVVSRYADGRVASRYADSVWDWTPYVPSGRRSVLSFQLGPKEGALSPAQQALTNELHWLMYLLAWKRPGATPSHQTLVHYLKTLRAAAGHCEAEGLTIQGVLTDHARLLQLVNDLPAVHAKQLSSILAALAEMGPGVVGFAVLGEQTKRALRGLSRQYAETLRQHPPLPARIYSHVIATLTRELQDFEQVADQFLALAARCIANPLLGRTKSIQWASAKRRGVDRAGFEAEFSTLAREHGVASYFEAKGLSHGVRGLSVGLSRMQTICRLVIQVFSGMRDEETGQLPYACLVSSTTGGRPHHVIEGATTKLNHGKRKAARWVTNGEGARAVLLARRIAELCWRASRASATIPLQSLEAAPLFVSVAYLGLAGKPPVGERLIASRFDLGGIPDLRTLLQPIILEQDLKELEQLDPHRAWRSEAKFQLGQPWTLTTHQLRRSLALYAQRSGLVSLPSLRRQLQHLTEEMSRYYAKGSSFADDFIGKDKAHFGNEWREMQPVSSALSYILNVLTTDDVLFGAHSNWVEHRLYGKDGALLVDREATIKRFQKGELAYKETFLGGCTSTEVCTTQPIKWLDIDCVKGCKNMVGRASKLDRAIAAQTRFVESLDPATPEFRTEHADLQVLLNARQKVQERLTESKS